MPITHAFVSAKSDGADATLVRASNWNDDHVAPPWMVPLSGGRVSVTPPSGLTEVDTALRTVIDLTNLTGVHLVASVVDAASSGTKLLFQTSGDQSAWTTRAEVAVDTTGVHVGYLGTVALGEVYCRLATSGGDNSNQLILGSVTLVEGGEAAPPGGPSFAHLSTGTAAGSASSTTVAVPKPAAFAENDLLVVVLVTGNVPVTGVPSGWTLAHENLNSAYARIYWKLAASSEPSTWSWTIASAGAIQGQCVAYGGDTGITVDVYSDADNSGTSLTLPSVTLTTANSLLVAAMGSGGSRTYTPPGSMTERIDANGSPALSCGLSDELVAASGATGTRAFTISSSTATPGVLVAFKG